MILMITSISSLFYKNSSAISLIISHDSELRTIEESAFNGMVIKSLYIQSKVEELKDGWCKNACNLNQISVSPSNKYFTVLDKIII